jgi:copper chaperone CopZ
MNEMFYGGSEPHWLKQSQYKRPHDYTADFDNPNFGLTLPTHEFRVPMCCPKCEEKVREELSELEGVYEIFVDQVHERVSVTGFVDAYRALKKMKRIKKKSQFWDDGINSHNSSSSHGKKTFWDDGHNSTSSHKSSSSHSKKTHHSRDHETVYRSSPSQVSHRRDRSFRLSNEVSFPNRRTKNYDDEGAYRPTTSANRNKFFGDEGAYRPATSAHRNKFIGSYDDEISYRPAKKFYGAYDDEIAFRPSRTRFCDSPSSTYRDQYYYDSRPSSSLFSSSPRSRSLRYESVPPYAQEYYTEEPVEQYPFYVPY